MEQEIDEGKIQVDRELEVFEPQILEDGKHSGVISKVIYRDQPYPYVDIYVRPDEKDYELKVGYSQYISQNSALGELLTRFGIALVRGERLNLYSLLVNKRVEFISFSEAVSKDGKTRNYSVIVKESLKPAKTDFQTSQTVAPSRVMSGAAVPAAELLESSTVNIAENTNNNNSLD